MIYDETLEENILGELLTLLKPDLESAPYAAGVVDYRSFPDRLERFVALTVVRARLGEATVAGGTGDLHVGAALGATYEPRNATSEEQAERALGAMTGKIVQAIDTSRNQYWSKVIWNVPGGAIVRPPNDPDTPNLRYGEVHFILKLK